MSSEKSYVIGGKTPLKRMKGRIGGEKKKRLQMATDKRGRKKTKNLRQPYSIGERQQKRREGEGRNQQPVGKKKKEVVGPGTSQRRTQGNEAVEMGLQKKVGMKKKK